MNEHEFEAAHGLPEPLPQGERVLWQGSPDWRAVTRRVFHAGPIAVYFGAMLAWRAGSIVADGGTAAQAAIAVASLVPLALAALGILALMGWLVGRTTVYTITDRRLVMRIGVVLTVTFNLPFRVIQSAALRTWSDGTGDIPVTLAAEDHIAYLHLWPHTRPWRVARPEPMLRGVPDAMRVAEILTRAVAASQGASVQASARATSEAPAPGPQPLAAAH